MGPAARRKSAGDYHGLARGLQPWMWQRRIRGDRARFGTRMVKGPGQKREASL